MSTPEQSSGPQPERRKELTTFDKIEAATERLLSREQEIDAQMAEQRNALRIEQERINAATAELDARKATALAPINDELERLFLSGNEWDTYAVRDVIDKLENEEEARRQTTRKRMEEELVSPLLQELNELKKRRSDITPREFQEQVDGIDKRILKAGSEVNKRMRQQAPDSDETSKLRELHTLKATVDRFEVIAARKAIEAGSECWHPYSMRKTETSTGFMAMTTITCRLCGKFLGGG